MNVTVIGHAGLLIETEFGSITCDPWFEPAFLGSWFVFPRNDQLAPDLMDRITHPRFLYISHLHGDHLDESFLVEKMSKDVTVLLPGFPTDELERELRRLGFTRFEHLPNGEAVDFDGLEVMVCVETAVADGPQGDSLIVVSDGANRIVNQNDCRPHSFDLIAQLGPVDVQFLQYSGAIWYPMVYEVSPEEMTRLSRLKREAQLARAMQYVKLVDARAVVPFAGPPAFLDPDLFAVNDLGNPNSIFPDQTVFLELLEQASARGLFTVPGSVVHIAPGAITVTHSMSEEEARWPYEHKADALAAYAADWGPWLAAERASWTPPQPDLVGRLAAWWEPLLQSAPHLRAGVGANVLIRSGDSDVLIDFPAGEVRAWEGEDHAFRFTIGREVLETVVGRRAVDWSNALFLSCRFSAWRGGAYNEYVYNFFKSLSPERMARAEREAAAALQNDPSHIDEFRCGDFFVDRFCPHRQADLTTFGEVDGTILTCTLHGWQFDLETGTCLTSADRAIRSRRADAD
ncbi:MAG: Rieske 2Fe-2S domain-containing protein [Acidimicrobiia bacterium]